MCYIMPFAVVLCLYSSIQVSVGIQPLYACGARPVENNSSAINQLTQDYLKARGWSAAKHLIGPVYCIGVGRDDNVYISYYLSRQDVLILVYVEEHTRQVDGDSLSCKPEGKDHILTFFNRDSAMAIASDQLASATKLYPPVLSFAGPHSSEVALEYDGPFWRFWDQEGNEYYMYTNLGLIPSRVAARNHFDLIDAIQSNKAGNTGGGE